MFRNYLTIAFRNLLRQKGYSAINIIGLGVGMACSILILLWVRHEVSFNRFNEKSDRLFRLVQTQHYISGPLTTPCMPGPVCRDLLAEIPEINDGFMYYVVPGIVSYGEKFFTEDVRFADSALWDMFTFDFIRGDRNNLFHDINSAVITDKLALKYFGEEDPIGKVLMINKEHQFKVTGIIRETPLNSTFRFDICVPFEVVQNFGFRIDRYGWNNYYSYVELAPGVDYRDVNEKIRDFLILKSTNPSQDVKDPSYTRIELFLFPLNDIYLHSLTGSGGNITYVYIFSIIAVFILIIACINFMNLSTARAARRSREIGLRKVTGASREQIIIQFLGESLLITMIGFLVAILLVYLFLPGFNTLADKTLSFDWLSAGNVLGLIAILLFVGILSGSYPAFYLSSLEPVRVLKNGAYKGSRGYNFRRLLVVFQFSLSIAMIICTIVVYRQLSYIERKDTGMDRENVIYLEMRGSSASSFQELKTAYLQNPSVQSVTRANCLPFDIGSNSGGLNWEGRDSEDKILIGFGFADVDYIGTLGMKMKEGRFFEEGYATDTSGSIIINESAARVMELKDPIDKWISWGDRRFNIIGVIQDFHFLPMTKEISPLVLINAPGYSSTIFIKVDGRDKERTIGYLQDSWEKINPGFPFEYKFLDDSYRELYISEDRLGRIFKYFAILTVFISCLGLFGLAAFMAEQRKKEIGIRKVMGAGLSRIVLTLSGNYLTWVVMANIIAWPVTYFFMNRWLEGYAYHTRLSPWIFILSGLISLLIALITVGYQTLRAASRDPVKSIKYE